MNNIKSRIKLIQGDITIQRFDAIVSPANRSLLGGGGVDGAIHRAAGHDLLEECEAICGCREGEAKLTKSYDLRCRGISWIIHAVAPRCIKNTKSEEQILKSAYKNSLDLAVNYKREYVRQCRDILMKYMDSLDYDEAVELLKEVVYAAEDYIDSHPITTIAFSHISTGAYDFSVEHASKIAITTIVEFLRKNDEIETIAIVCKDRESYEVYERLIDKIK